MLADTSNLEQSLSILQTSIPITGADGGLDEHSSTDPVVLELRLGLIFIGHDKQLNSSY